MMGTHSALAPDFFVIGAQKAGTSWLWNMLDQHPGTSLPKTKEIHYFGSSELYRKGYPWYLSHFDDCDPNRLIGEASTTYFFDRVPYWYNDSEALEFDANLATIPELILQKVPDAKFIVVLRDPVRRAISAYHHWLSRGQISPMTSLRDLATRRRKLRILEFGYYARYLELWLSKVDRSNFHIVIFEDDTKADPVTGLRNVYGFLGLDPAFRPDGSVSVAHKSWSWTRIMMNYYTSRLYRPLGNSRLGPLCDRFDVLSNLAASKKDVEFLRSEYLPEKERLVQLIDRPLSSWDYGESLLR